MSLLNPWIQATILKKSTTTLRAVIDFLAFAAREPGSPWALLGSPEINIAPCPIFIFF